MTAYHQLTPSLFEGLASGRGGPAAIAELHHAQVSRHLLLIQHLLGSWPGPDEEGRAVAALLEAARERAPGSFTEIVGAPLVGGWTAVATRALANGKAVRADFTHLGALAVVACAAAGVDAEAEAPIHDGRVMLPGLGAAEMTGADTAYVTAEGGRMTVRGGGTTVVVPADPSAVAPRWQPVRVLHGLGCPDGVRIGLDDLDPYRHGHHVPPAQRLADDAVARWRDAFGETWTLLAERLPERAEEMRAGLRTLVPLRQTDERTARSATIRHAFGVFGLTLPPSPAEFAVTMVHEFQHSKLSALLDLVILTDPDDDGRYFAPWRVDPRPLAGLLQGVYAFAGVADAWQALRGVPGLERTADTKFAESRLQVDRGLTAVEESGALTREGVALAGHLRRVTDAMLAAPVGAGAAETALRQLEQTHRRWSDRNHVPG